MAIEWFPGHMSSARKKAAETMAKVDVVIEVLDARLPGASSNPLIAKLRHERQRPCLKLLNKADLADPEATAAWVRHFGKEKGVMAVAISSKRKDDVAKVPGLAAALVPHRDGKSVRMMVMGVPNVGKSTLVNGLLKRKAAKTGDEPAITRHQSRFTLNERHELIDTPGLMAPSILKASDAYLLAASHLIGPESYTDEDVATYLGDLLSRRYPGLLRTRYDLQAEKFDGFDVITAIAKKRGYLRKGGTPDLRESRPRPHPGLPQRPARPHHPRSPVDRGQCETGVRARLVRKPGSDPGFYDVGPWVLNPPTRCCLMSPSLGPTRSAAVRSSSLETFRRRDQRSRSSSLRASIRSSSSWLGCSSFPTSRSGMCGLLGKDSTLQESRSEIGACPQSSARRRARRY